MFERRPSAWSIAAGVALVAYAIVVVRSAWIADDALISFRSIHNVVDGYGPRWNVVDRVQVFTHPLWMWVLTGLFAATGDLIQSAHGLALACSVASVALVARVATTSAMAFVAILALLGSRAFVDYSASGLENPLTHLLLVTFAIQSARSRDATGFTRLVLVGSLLLLNRLDTALLVGPSLFVSYWIAVRRDGLGSTTLRATLASAPLWCWLGFAAFYYATPFPIAAYAKAFSPALPALDVAAQAARYYRYTAVHDPITLVAIAVGCLYGIRRAETRTLAIGALIYLLYLFRVGGDFMGGRFFAAPLLVAVVCVVRSVAVRARAAGIAAVAVAIIASLGARPTVLAAHPGYHNRAIDAGIADERGFYYQISGWLSPNRREVAFGSVAAAIESSSIGGIEIVPGHAVGAAGMGLGRASYVLDVLLCDPLLARLPAYDPTDWRPGHVERRVPDGYIESLITGENRIADPDLARYWDTLRTALRGDLFAPERLAAVWRLWTADREFLRRYVERRYRAPTPRVVRAEQVNQRLDVGIPFYDPRVLRPSPAGIHVQWSRPVRTTGLELGLDAADRYRIGFWSGWKRLTEIEVSTGGAMLHGLRHHSIEVPRVARAGFDRLSIEPIATEDVAYSFGFVIADED